MYRGSPFSNSRYCTYPQPSCLGEGDLHDKAYNSMVRSFPFHSSPDGHDGHHDETACSYTFDVYPSKEFEAAYDSNSAMVAAVTLGGTFLMVAIVFLLYDYFMNVRNRKVKALAVKSTQLVNAMFPENVRDRILANGNEEDENMVQAKTRGRRSSEPASPTKPSKPIAGMFGTTQPITQR